MSSPTASFPASVPYYPPLYNNMANARFNPTMAVIIIVIIGGCFVLGFMSVFVRRCMSGGTEMVTFQRTLGGPPTWMSKCRGLDKEAVDALPLVRSSDLHDEDHDRECPVCLTEFEPEDTLRLLPPCQHVFHQECIDAWFDAHSTCPLCRANLQKFAAGVAKQKNATNAGGSLRQPAATVSVAPDSDDGGIELQPAVDGDPREDSIRELIRGESQPTVATPQPGTISREHSLSSARGTLSRNSQSFKRAARGATAVERAESIGAGGVLKPPIARRKPPLPPASTTTSGIRRSASVGADLILLRKLLISNEQSGSQGGSTSPSRSYRLRVAKSEMPPSSSASGSWFPRTRSMELPRRNGGLQSSGSDKWVAVDLEAGKPAAAAVAPGASTSKGESSAGAAPEPTWSDRWSLASLRGAMFPLSRSSSDVPSNPSNPSQLPV